MYFRDILERELRCTENVVDKQALSFSQSVSFHQRSTLTFTHIHSHNTDAVFNLYQLTTLLNKKKK